MADLSTLTAPLQDPISGLAGNAPAPAPAPEPVPQPKPPAQPPTPKPSMPLSAQYQKDIGQMQPMYQKAAEAEQALNIGAKQAEFTGTEKKLLAYSNANKEYIKNTYGSEAYKNLDRTVKEVASNTEFIPSKENAKDLSMMFTLISLVGFGIGRGAKGNAQAAMSAMNGMMEGHIQGRDDLYKREKATFETNLKALQSKLTALQEQFKVVQEMAATDRKTAEIQADSLLLKEQADFLKGWKDKFGTNLTGQQIDKMVDAMKEVYRLRSEEQSRAVQGMQLLQGKDGWYAINPATGTAKLIEGTQGLFKPGKGVGSVGYGGFLQNVIGVSSGDPKQDKEIVETARAVVGTDNLLNKLRDKDIKTGVQLSLEQIQQRIRTVTGDESNRDLTDAEINSYINNAIDPNNKNAVFIKEALFTAFQVEREVQGGRLTVQMMKQGGQALDPKAYTKEAYADIVGTRRSDLYRKLNGFNLDPAQQQSLIGRINEAPPAFSSEIKPGESKPMPSPEKLKAYADKFFSSDVTKATEYLQSQGYK